MLALMVTIKIKPAHREAFMAAMLGDARGSTYDEPGCLRFDVLQDASDPNTLYLSTRSTAIRRRWRRTSKRHTSASGGRPSKIGLTEPRWYSAAPRCSPTTVPGRQ